MSNCLCVRFLTFLSVYFSHSLNVDAGKSARLLMLCYSLLLVSVKRFGFGRNLQIPALPNYGPRFEYLEFSSRTTAAVET